MVEQMWRKMWRSAGRRCMSSYTHGGIQNALKMEFDQPRLHRQNSTKMKPSGLFGIDLLRKPEGLLEMKDRALTQARLLTEQIARTESSGSQLVRQMDDLSDAVCAVVDLAQLVRMVHSDRSFIQAADDAFVSLSAFLQELNTNVHLNHRLDKLLSNASMVNKLSPEELAVAQILQFDFHSSGIHLPDDTRAKFRDISDRITRLGMTFAEGAQNSSRTISVPMSKLSGQKDIKPLLRLLSTDRHGNFLVPMDAGIVLELLRTTSDGQVRELLYREFYASDPTRLATLDELLKARHDIANLVGYPSYATLTLRRNLIKTPEKVKSFLETLAGILRQPSLDNVNTLRDYKRKYGLNDSNPDVIEAWDNSFFSGIAKYSVAGVASSELKSYFSLGNCMAGLDMITRHLYGIELRCVPTAPGEVWAHDVSRIDVVEQKSDTVLGQIYCDLFVRPNKVRSAAHFTIRCSKRLSEYEYQTPIVVLICNFTHPSTHQPSLLDPSEVETLFHEMGHALHSMLAKTEMQILSGTRCQIDFVETPSILMEYFARDARVLAQFARHYKTNEVIPLDLVNTLHRSARLFAPMDTQTQVIFSLLDQEYHGQYPLPASTSDILSGLNQRWLGYSTPQGTAWQTEFTHLVGYGSSYYSYLQCQVFAAHIWYKYFEHDPLSRESGERYRHTILAPGGTKDPNLMLKDMLGEEPSPEYLLQHLGLTTNWSK